MMLLPLITWLEAVSVSILRREVAPFPPFSLRALGQEVLHEGCTEGVGHDAPPPSQNSIYITYLEFFCMGDLSVLSHLIIYSYQHGIKDIYFFFEL